MIQKRFAKRYNNNRDYTLRNIAKINVSLRVAINVFYKNRILTDHMNVTKTLNNKEYVHSSVSQNVIRLRFFFFYLIFCHHRSSSVFILFIHCIDSFNSTSAPPKTFWGNNKSEEFHFIYTTGVKRK